MLWISTIIALIIEVLSYLYFILHCWNSVDNHRATLIAFPGATASRWRKMVSGIRRCVKGDRLTGRSWYIFSLFAIFQRVFPVTDRFSRRWNRSHERRKKRNLSSDAQNRRGINGWTWGRCTTSLQRWGEKAVLQLPSTFLSVFAF